MEAKKENTMPTARHSHVAQPANRFDSAGLKVTSNSCQSPVSADLTVQVSYLIVDAAFPDSRC